MFGLYQTAFGMLTWGNILMLFIGGGLIYLGIAKKMEPVLLVPIGIGIMMVNIPFSGLMVYAPAEPGAVPMPMMVEGGIGALGEAMGSGKIGLLNVLYQFGVANEAVSYTHLTLPTICSV